MNARREFTIMVSTAASRPANATTDCGVAWLPAGPAPTDGLLMRNMLPVPSFKQAIQRVERGHEGRADGRVLPARNVLRDSAGGRASRRLPARERGGKTPAGGGYRPEAEVPEAVSGSDEIEAGARAVDPVLELVTVLLDGLRPPRSRR